MNAAIQPMTVEGDPWPRAVCWDEDVPLETWKVSSVDEHLRLERDALATNMALL